MKVNRLSGLALVASVCLLSGCGILFPQEPSVLEGVWQLQVADNTDLGPSYLTFDSKGDLVLITVENSQDVTTVVPDPQATVTVDGSDVTISAPSLLAGSLTFTGSLNGDNTVITGEVTTTITVGNLVIIEDKGAATLTKQ
jgi:hypothetical protein